MNKTILFAIFTLTLGWAVAQAQTSASRSRLDMPYKKKVNVLEKTFSKSNVIEYKPLSVNKPQAMNSYYRSLLFANEPANLASKESTQVSVPTERRVTTFDEREKVSEGQLFSNDKLTVSNIYPNPASEYAELDYNVKPSLRDVRLIIYNVLGSQVKEYTLDKGEKKLFVNTREMPTGIYFYQLSVEGEKVATKKMLVRHQQ